VEETGVPRENHRTATSHWKPLSHNVVWVHFAMNGVRTRNRIGDRHWLQKTSLKISKGLSESDEQTTRWSTEKVQKHKQWSTKHTYKTNRVTRIPLKTGGEHRCSKRVSSSCSTSGTCHVNLVTHPVISREWGKDMEVIVNPPTMRSQPRRYLMFEDIKGIKRRRQKEGHMIQWPNEKE
jgi:hypothetical protein